MSSTPENRGRIALKDPETIDECWITQADYSFLSGYSDDQIIEACSEINRMCNRKFNHQEADAVVIQEATLYYSYNTFILPNYPIKSVTDIYLQILDTFNKLDLTYLQTFTEESVLKLVPILTADTNSALPQININPNTNVWVRYDSGFKVNGDITNDYPTVPSPIKKATAMMAKYLSEIDSLPIGVKQFSTQTYSQTNAAKLEEDAYFVRIKQLLQKYVINNYA